MKREEIRQKKIQTQEKIKIFCYDEPRSLKEISDMLMLNKHTVRTVYLYPMVKTLTLTPVNNQKFGRYTKYITSK